jgi:hypothetical protein
MGYELRLINRKIQWEPFVQISVSVLPPLKMSSMLFTLYREDTSQILMACFRRRKGSSESLQPYLKFLQLKILNKPKCINLGIACSEVPQWQLWGCLWKINGKSWSNYRVGEGATRNLLNWNGIMWTDQKWGFRESNNIFLKVNITGT